MVKVLDFKEVKIEFFDILKFFRNTFFRQELLYGQTSSLGMFKMFKTYSIFFGPDTVITLPIPFS